MNNRHTLYLNAHWRIDGYRVPGTSWRGGRLELHIAAVSGLAREFGVVDARANGYPDAAMICTQTDGPATRLPGYIRRECERLLGLRRGRKRDAVLADLKGVI